jgi:class 3 adenylate cyclase
VSAVPQTRFVRADGGPALAYQVLGDGERDIFYVAQPAPPIDLMWDDPLLARGLRRLASAGRLLTCDLRGWGSSDAVDASNLPALQAWMDDIGRVMDAAGSERTVLFGMAEQGLPCILFAASHPERVQALVLWSPFARYLRADDHPCGMPAEAAEVYARGYGEMNGTGNLASLFAPSRAEEPGFREWFARAERLGLRPANCEPVYSRVFQPSDLRDVARTIACPTLLMRRTGDRHVRDGHARDLLEIMRDARLVELEGEDHVWWSGDSETPIDEALGFVTGLRAGAVQWDRQLATVLFTDIVDSTRVAATLGDEVWSARLARHDELAARFVTAFQGRLVKSTGDGILATFDGPARAIRCASDLRDALAAEGLVVRSGLHTGEVGVTDDDVHGLAVHVAARVAARAAAGEVLVSEAVPPLVLGSALRFADRGTAELKGVPGEWRLWAASE